MGDYAKALGSKLRGIRQQQGLSLHGVEQKSGGRCKAVVVGSYERGDRAVTVQKLAELADFYGVPVAELLPEGRIPSGSEPATKIVINLERLQQLPADKVGPPSVMAGGGPRGGGSAMAVLVDTRCVPPGERFECWHEAASKIFFPLRVSRRAEDARAAPFFRRV